MQRFELSDEQWVRVGGFLGSAQKKLSEKMVGCGIALRVLICRGGGVLVMRRARDGCPFEDAIRPAVEERMRGSYQTLSEKDGRRDAALERGGWDAVGSGMWRGCWDVRVGPSSVAWESWINCLTIRRRGACRCRSKKGSSPSRNSSRI